jgi:hypothetical protein
MYCEAINWLIALFLFGKHILRIPDNKFSYNPLPGIKPGKIKPTGQTLKRLVPFAKTANLKKCRFAFLVEKNKIDI